MLKRFFLYAALLCAFSCASKKIPGTDLSDTDSNRALLEMLDEYRRAVEDQDAERVVRLLDTSFVDDGGSADVSDDMDHANARQRMETWFSRVKDVRLNLNFRKLERSKSEPDIYFVSYSYMLSFSMGDKAKQDSDIKQMRVRKTKEGVWLIQSGI